MKKTSTGRRIRFLTGAMFFAAFAVLTAGQALAAGGEIPVGPGWPQSETLSETADLEESSGGDGTPEWLTEEVRNVILVEAENRESSHAVITYYQKEEDWEAVFSVSGLVGRAGITDPGDKKEGDKKTPAGVYGFTTAFGILEDPGCRMEYHQLKEGDVWVDDSRSVHYNRMANAAETEKDWSSAEDLAVMAPWYDYVLALDYNQEQTPGKGSAIFLHCMKEGDSYTSGCISVPEEYMMLLLQNADRNTRIVIR